MSDFVPCLFNKKAHIQWSNVYLLVFAAQPDRSMTSKYRERDSKARLFNNSRGTLMCLVHVARINCARTSNDSGAAEVYDIRLPQVSSADAVAVKLTT